MKETARPSPLTLRGFRLGILLGLLLAGSALTAPVTRAAAGPSPEASPRLSETDLDPESLVKSLYDEVTFEAGKVPDWDRVRSLFLPEAVVVLRTARDATTVFSLEGFVADFVAFIDRAKVVETGFSERIIKMRTEVYGDLAGCMVVYEASIPGSGRPPQRGLDSFQLARREGRWWIVAITNELVSPERPLPEGLSE